MRVTAQLNIQPSARRLREAGRHDLCCTPIERKWRDHHAPVANGHEILFTGEILCIEQRHPIGAGRGGHPPRVARQRPLVRALLPSARRSLAVRWWISPVAMIPTPLSHGRPLLSHHENDGRVAGQTGLLSCGRYGSNNRHNVGETAISSDAYMPPTVDRHLHERPAQASSCPLSASSICPTQREKRRPLSAIHRGVCGRRYPRHRVHPLFVRGLSVRRAWRERLGVRDVARHLDCRCGHLRHHCSDHPWRSGWARPPAKAISRRRSVHLRALSQRDGIEGTDDRTTSAA